VGTQKIIVIANANEKLDSHNKNVSAATTAEESNIRTVFISKSKPHNKSNRWCKKNIQSIDTDVHTTSAYEKFEICDPSENQ